MSTRAGCASSSVCTAWTSHDQPLPKRAAPAALTCRLSSRIDPKVASMASASGSAGRPWSTGVMGNGLAVTSTANQDSPLMRGATPLLGVDVWEHAYYLRYQHRRADYLEAWWNVVDWQRVAARYATATSRNAGGDHA
jgi:superoxide dismutase, Fe-Mn family